MIELVIGCIAVAIAVLVELLFPDHAIYQAGWYNALLIGAFVLCAVRAASVARERAMHPGAVALTIAGTCVLTIAGVANGLFAPEAQTVIGSPGASVRVDDLRGSLTFPLSSTDPVVRFDSGGSIVDVPANGGRIAGAFVLSQISREVLAVDVADARGAHLTVTQPSGSAFLSPVLTMPSEQLLAGMTLPFDSFAVPAAHRIVKAALFDARHAAMLKQVDTGGRGAALFAVDDEEDRPVPNGIGMAIDGGSVALAGLRLRPTILAYPAIRVAPVPLPVALVAGLLLLIAGAWWGVSRRRLDATPANV